MAHTEREEFRELATFTVMGYVLGIGLGYVLDLLGLQRNPVGEWVVRSLSGETESAFEGIFALKKRLLEGGGHLAEAYGWGKLAGMIVPWVVDWGSRAAGVNMYSPESFYVPYLYSMSDQIGATLSMLLFFYRKEGNLVKGAAGYLRNPVSIASLVVILLVPIGILTVRLLGFSPTRQVLVALETAASNLCWVPPLVGVIFGGKEVGNG